MQTSAPSTSATLGQRSKPTNFLTTDILILDRIMSADCHPEIRAIMNTFGCQPGSKGVIDRTTSKKILGVMANNLQHSFSLGGSAANSLRTIKALLDGGVNADFVGCLGNGGISDIISGGLESSGINLLNGSSKDSQTRVAQSFVFKYPDGERAILTDPGNARDIISPEMFPESLIAKTDVLFLQGTIARKFPEEVINHILKHRWDHGIKMFLALPTSAFHEGYFKWLAASADVLMSNTDELGYVFGEDKPLHRLADHQIKDAHVLREKGHSPQVAFVTDGPNGAYIVCEGAITPIAACPAKKVNTLGAGDASFAGFITGHLLGWSHEEAANLGMALGAATIQIEGSVVENPLQSVKALNPALGAKLEVDIAAQLATQHSR